MLANNKNNNNAIYKKDCLLLFHVSTKLNLKGGFYFLSRFHLELVHSKNLCLEVQLGI